MKPQSTHFWLWLRLLVATGLIIWLLQTLDWAILRQQVRQIAWSWWILCSAIPLGGILLSAWKWHGLLRLFGIERHYREVLGRYWSGTFYNNVLPGSVGGDVIKIGGFSRSGVPLSSVTVSVLLDRLSGLWMGALLGLVACLWPSQLPFRFALGLAFTCIVVGGLVGALLLPWLVAFVPPRWQHFAASVPTIIWQRRFLPTLGFAAGFQSLVILHLWSAGMAFQTPLSLLACAMYAQALVIITLLPVSLNGIGVREGALVVLLGAVMVAPETATLIGSTLFMTAVLASLPGGLIVIRHKSDVAQMV